MMSSAPQADFSSSQTSPMRRPPCQPSPRSDAPGVSTGLSKRFADIPGASKVLDAWKTTRKEREKLLDLTRTVSSHLYFATSTRYLYGGVFVLSALLLLNTWSTPPVTNATPDAAKLGGWFFSQSLGYVLEVFVTLSLLFEVLMRLSIYGRQEFFALSGNCFDFALAFGCFALLFFESTRGPGGKTSSLRGIGKSPPLVPPSDTEKSLRMALEGEELADDVLLDSMESLRYFVRLVRLIPLAKGQARVRKAQGEDADVNFDKVVQYKRRYFDSEL